MSTKLEEENRELRNALQCIYDWYRNLDVSFLDDPEWGVDDKNIRRLLGL